MTDKRKINLVIPAKAGIQRLWVPAFAGTTVSYAAFLP
jgi:hypothetical protein